MTPEIAARLESLRIQLAAQGKDYCMFLRENCVALAQFRDGAFTSIGSSGMMTEKGLAYLFWNEGRPMLAAHGGAQIPAGPDQVEAIRSFSADLETALNLQNQNR